MKKARLIAGMTAALPAAAGALAGPAAAHAAQATPALASRPPAKGKTVTVVHHGTPRTTGPRWAPISYEAEYLHLRRGGSIRIPVGYSVFVTCYYRGNTGNPDPFWDHVSYYRDQPFISPQYAVGHIADRHVNLNGLPSQVGIPKCGRSTSTSASG